MSRLLPVLTFAVLLPLAGCQTPSSPPPAAGRPSVVLEEPEEWRSAASDADATMVEALPATWIQALAETRRRYGRAVSAEGDLLDPQVRLPRADPAPGPYRCRAVRIGARVAGVRPWSTTRTGFCFVGVEDDQLSLSSEIPGLRFGGYLFGAKEKNRLVFLGAVTPARARTAIAYGENAAMDRAGIVERVGTFRYRLVLPSRDGDSRLTVVEMIAAPDPE